MGTMLQEEGAQLNTVVPRLFREGLKRYSFEVRQPMSHIVIRAVRELVERDHPELAFLFERGSYISTNNAQEDAPK